MHRNIPLPRIRKGATPPFFMTDHLSSSRSGCSLFRYAESFSDWTWKFTTSLVGTRTKDQSLPSSISSESATKGGRQSGALPGGIIGSLPPVLASSDLFCFSRTGRDTVINGDSFFCPPYNTPRPGAGRGPFIFGRKLPT